jgi:exosortase B
MALPADPHRSAAAWVPWMMLLLGWAAVFGPTYWDLAHTLWQTEDQAHGVLILAVVLWLLWQRQDALLARPDAGLGNAPRTLAGSVVFGVGLLLYVVGRSQDILLFEIGAQIPVLAGALLILRGGSAMRAAWFPLLYIAFMVPLPGILVDALTGPLKQWISVIAEQILYAIGYPIARNGVVLSIGPYQLLVADACSGLHSMFSLSALGLLYMFLTARKSWLHNGLMLASILPIAFVANIIRVMVLILVTYHLGDEAGQGFLHGFAGIVLLISALLCLFALDSLLARVIKG